MDAKLLNKYIAGDALPEEKKEVIRWMKESEENREQLMQLHRVYNATIWNGNLQAEKYHFGTLRHALAAIMPPAVPLLQF